MEAHLKEHHLPAELLARHQEAVQSFHSRKAEFVRLMQAVERADDTAKAKFRHGWAESRAKDGAWRWNTSLCLDSASPWRNDGREGYGESPRDGGYTPR